MQQISVFTSVVFLFSLLLFSLLIPCVLNPFNLIFTFHSHIHFLLFCSCLFSPPLPPRLLPARWLKMVAYFKTDACLGLEKLPVTAVATFWHTFKYFKTFILKPHNNIEHFFLKYNSSALQWANASNTNVVILMPSQSPIKLLQSKCNMLTSKLFLPSALSARHILLLCTIIFLFLVVSPRPPVQKKKKKEFHSNVWVIWFLSYSMCRNDTCD